MSRKPRALIVGGGVAGPACALFLKAAGWDVSVFEAHPGRAEVGAALTLAPNGLHVLGRLGLAEAVLRAGSVVGRYRFLSERGRELGRMRPAPEGRYRYPSVSLSRATFYGLVLDEVERRGVELQFGRRLTAIEQDGAQVVARFADGGAADGDILVGADGVRSAVRTAILPDAPAPAFTGLVGGGGFLPRSRLLQLMGPLGEDVMTFAFGRRGFFGCAFGDRQEEDGAYWWYSLPRARPLAEDERRALAGPAAADAVLRAGGGWSPFVRNVIAATRRFIAPLDIFDVPSTPRWRAGRSVLIGDAAHAVAPHSGQGASMALEDALTLSARLAEQGEDPQAAFAAFEQQRRARAERVVAMGRRLGEQKAGGWLAARVRELLMPVFLRLAPSQDWLFGHEAS